MDGVSLEVLLIALGILANGFFAGSEMALVSSRQSRLAELRERGVRGAGTALSIRQSPEAALATIQIAITAVGTLASAVGGAAAVEALTPWLVVAGVPPRVAEIGGLGAVIVAITYASLVVGELTPKAIALRNPERMAALVARPITVLSRLSRPLVRVLTASTNAVLAMLRVQPPAEPVVSEEELRYLLREGAARGIFEKREEELVHRVFEFTDTTVREIMVPRLRVQGLPVDTPPDDVLGAVVAIGHTRIPVYRESIEHPVGVLVLKDVLERLAAGLPLVLADMLHPPLFVPETSKISVLLEEFRRRRQNLAIVVDEYGGVAGLVTVEDLLEEVVGEIHDEARAPSTHVTLLPDGSALVDGATPVEELRETLGVAVPDSTAYTTAAGALIAKLDRIPTPGTTAALGGFRWTVLEMERATVKRIKLERA
jgi:putative hemolysin